MLGEYTMWYNSEISDYIKKSTENKFNIDNFKTWYGGVNLPKLDAWSHNKLLGKGIEIYGMSLSEKLKELLTDTEYKTIKGVI